MKLVRAMARSLEACRPTVGADQAKYGAKEYVEKGTRLLKHGPMPQPPHCCWQQAVRCPAQCTNVLEKPKGAPHQACERCLLVQTLKSCKRNAKLQIVTT